MPDVHYVEVMVDHGFMHMNQRSIKFDSSVREYDARVSPHLHVGQCTKALACSEISLPLSALCDWLRKMTVVAAEASLHAGRRAEKPL